MADKTLRQWGDDQNLSYHKAWRKFINNEVPNAYMSNKGRIFVKDNPVISSSPAPVENNNKQLIKSDSRPEVVDFAYQTQASSPTRTNRSAFIEPSDRFTNIETGLSPFQSTRYNGRTYLSIRDAVTLTQLCYYNFSSFRNVIELMTEFSSSNIFFEGGNKKGRDFFLSYLDKISILDLQARFFREYFRSGNVFIYPLESDLQKEDIFKITQVYGAVAEKLSIAFKYIILNPSEISVQGSSSFGSPIYFKTLNSFEIAQLKNPQTEEDRLILENLAPSIKNNIKNNTTALIPLETNKIVYVPYCKQDYEPFAVPMGFGVLTDINRKEELKKMDMAICRTVQQAVLLITAGTEPEKGGINQAYLTALQEIFKNESVGRVLIGDYTTKAEFVIPTIGDILDPKKYEILEKDIQVGLNNILVGEDKFANQSIKVEIFVERLRQARNAFLNSFLIPQIKKIGERLGFKVIPTPKFEEINLKDELEYARIYTRLCEIGVLTPEETFVALDTNKLPTSEESVESQERLKEYRKKELYKPLIGGQKEEPSAKPNGRPQGVKRPQSTKKMTPIGK